MNIQFLQLEYQKSKYFNIQIHIWLFNYSNILNLLWIFEYQNYFNWLFNLNNYKTHLAILILQIQMKSKSKNIYFLIYKT